MFCDYHVHSYYSDDSKYLMEDVVKDAIRIGLEEIVFTDHVDYGVKSDWIDIAKAKYFQGDVVINVDYPKYFAEIAHLQEKYNGQIAIKRGLEYGVQLHTIAQYEALARQYPLDFALLSVHQIEDKEFWTGEFQEGKSIRECYLRYYQEMYDVVTNFHDYSCLAHMDMMRRYLAVKDDQALAFMDEITNILSYIIQNGKGIEVNTSTVRYGLDGTMPSLDILKRFHELGGTIITIGSDSHKPEHLGSYIAETKQLLKEIGFTSFCTFDQMEPIFHPL